MIQATQPTSLPDVSFQSRQYTTDVQVDARWWIGPRQSHDRTTSDLANGWGDGRSPGSDTPCIEVNRHRQIPQGTSGWSSRQVL